MRLPVRTPIIWFLFNANPLSYTGLNRWLLFGTTFALHKVCSNGSMAGNSKGKEKGNESKDEHESRRSPVGQLI
jgi:hypothetical protein